jgi:hypothetical protein
VHVLHHGDPVATREVLVAEHAVVARLAVGALDADVLVGAGLGDDRMRGRTGVAGVRVAGAPMGTSDQGRHGEQA